MDKLARLNWPLIAGMGALALIRPFLSVVGVMDLLGKPFGPLFMTAVISLTWLTIAVFGRVRQPVLTLVFTGVAYGLLAIALSAVLSPILTGAFQGPLFNRRAVVPVLITNAIWGGVVGLAAWGLQRIVPGGHPENQGA
jgi:hypothetical protein